MTSAQNKFKEAYEEAVKEGLSILGENISAIINFYIADKYSIRLTDTHDNPKVLADALEAVIDGSSRIVERKILRLLYNKIGAEPPFAITTNFEDKIFKAKKEYERIAVNSRTA